MHLGGLAVDILRITAAGLVMALTVWVSCKSIGTTDGPAVGLVALTRVLVGIIVGAVTYVAALALLGEPHLRNYWSTRTTKSSR